MAPRTDPKKLAANRDYYHRNKERLKAYREAYYKANRSKLLESARYYRERHRERILAYARDYQERNKETLKAYRDAKRDILADYQRRYCRENAELVAEKKRLYRQRNANKIREYNRRRYQQTREAERERCRAKGEALRSRGRFGGGRNVEGIKALLEGKAGEVARVVALEAKLLGMRWGVGQVLEDVVQDVIVEMLCSPPPATELRKHARRLLSRAAARRTYRVSGMSFEDSPRLKRQLLGESYEG